MVEEPLIIEQEGRLEGVFLIFSNVTPFPDGYWSDHAIRAFLRDTQPSRMHSWFTLLNEWTRKPLQPKRNMKKHLIHYEKWRA